VNFFDVTIKATVTKTYTVQADNADAATQIAVDGFSVLADDAEEDYEQYVVSTTQLKEKS
jgi:hypothetical protein